MRDFGFQNYPVLNYVILVTRYSLLALLYYSGQLSGSTKLSLIAPWRQRIFPGLIRAFILLRDTRSPVGHWLCIFKLLGWFPIKNDLGRKDVGKGQVWGWRRQSKQKKQFWGQRQRCSWNFENGDSTFWFKQVSLCSNERQIFYYHYPIYPFSSWSPTHKHHNGSPYRW